ncbi:DUF5919 domain-containing protein [Actinomadura flavalba]|uniref:DUF5919 domain-containing protein n=1 Tax=Actinomadura flavalba TaxID=1120938 RepID=UPI00036EFAA7|nr:DUF5919 domain-containing protein [Actinomadura flavalba]
MTNLALRQAMDSAKLTADDLAAHCGVDVKTVTRWVAEEGRMPHPRHRWAVGQVLGVDHTVLWPESIRKNIKTGPDREIVAAYPYRSAVPKALWRSLISDATTNLVFAGYTNYFLWLEIPNLRSILRRKAERGCRIRFLLGDPASEITRRREEREGVPLTIGTRINITLDELGKMGETEGIDVRFSDDHIAMSVFIFDEDMLMSTHLANLVGHDSPVLHLRRTQSDGLYDRYAHHVTELWNGGRPENERPQQPS